MNKIKYPDKKQIDQQISLIVEKAGIFEDAEEQQEYEECVKVRNTKTYIRQIALLAGAVVMIAGIIIASKLGRIKPASSSSEPMTNVIENDTINKQTGTRINGQITVVLKGEGNRMFDSSKEELVKGTNAYTVPVVYYRGEEVSEITQFYQDKVDQLQKQIDAKFSYIDKGASKGTAINDLPIRTSLTCSTVTGISLKNTDVVTIFENYAETAKFNNSVASVNENYGNNFDASSGKRISITNLFADENAGMQQLATQLLLKIKGAHVKDSLTNNFQTTDSVMHYLIDGNWYFGSEGITICCNGIKQDSNSYAGVAYTSSSSEFYVIPYESLTYLKSEFSN